MKKCKYCGQTVETNVSICSSCGAGEFKYLCENCGNVFEDGLHCPKCGVKVGQKERICPTCGNRYFTNACSNCGYSELKAAAPKPFYTTDMQDDSSDSYAAREDNSVRIEFWLCLFLGFYGVHKFYRGKIGLGVLYLLTGGLFFIGWIVDLVALASKLWRI